MDPTRIYQMTHPAPMIWSHLVTPQPERKDSKGRVFKASYNTEFLLDAEHPDWLPIRTLLRRVASEDCPAIQNPQFPVTDGTKIADDARAKNKNREWARGKIMVKGKSNVAKLDGALLSPPRLVVLQNGAYVTYGVTNERKLADKFFYSGVLGIGTLSVDGYEGMGGGVTIYLNEALSLNTGERIEGGGEAPETKYGDVSRFASYTGHVSNIDPNEGLHGLV